VRGVLPPFVAPSDVPDGAALADVRLYLDGRSGRDAFLAGHLPGAVFVDPARGLAAPASDALGRHPLPTPAAFAEGMGAAGIADGTTVVAYDDQGGAVAARLVWLLRVLGEDAALLDGADPSAFTETGPGFRVAPATFTPRRWPAERLAEIEELDAGLPAGTVLLDARDAVRFAGGPDPVDPRSGHVPGAVSLPTRDHVGPDGRLLPVAQLRARFAAAGVGDTGVPVVSGCGSGVTACHQLLVLEHAGLGAGRLWPGSWSQWSRSDRPVATGPA
jgi:thiosulfate/3-mercaptopyruvate sulfurtransferase